MLAVSFPCTAAQLSSTTAAQHTRCFAPGHVTTAPAASILFRYSRLTSGSFTFVRPPQVLCRAFSGPQDINQGGSGPPPDASKPVAQGDADDEGSGTVTRRSWPVWYTVWIWTTALTYLVWRYKWRRDRRLTAEQLANEQQQEEELQQQWYDFARSYGVHVPPGNTS